MSGSAFYHVLTRSQQRSRQLSSRLPNLVYVDGVQSVPALISKPVETSGDVPKGDFVVWNTGELVVFKSGAYIRNLLPEGVNQYVASVIWERDEIKLADVIKVIFRNSLSATIRIYDMNSIRGDRALYDEDELSLFQATCIMIAGDNCGNT